MGEHWASCRRYGFPQRKSDRRATVDRKSTHPFPLLQGLFSRKCLTWPSSGQIGGVSGAENVAVGPYQN